MNTIKNTISDKLPVTAETAIDYAIAARITNVSIGLAFALRETHTYDTVERCFSISSTASVSSSPRAAAIS